MKKIGIMGGTFNPIHTAHLVIADAAYEQFGLSQVMFLPNYIPPHKEYAGSVSAEMRLAMVDAATGDDERFFVSDYEIKNGGLSYTVNTLEHFKKVYDEIYFIIGGDSLRDFPTWYHPEKISKLCKLLVYPRDGINIDACIDKLKKLYGAEVYKLYAPRIDISSTELREKIKSGKSVRYLIPDKTLEIIKNNKLYTE